MSLRARPARLEDEVYGRHPDRGTPGDPQRQRQASDRGGPWRLAAPTSTIEWTEMYPNSGE